MASLTSSTLANLNLRRRASIQRSTSSTLISILRLVLRVIGACGQHRAAVVAGEVLHRLGEHRLVAVGHGDQRAWVVGHDELG